ncbi:MAG: 50S ribosomal protein L24 [Candidatus Omnitrophica bacterium]|nr:50S ribosomal protein L24 [Candidatus Omnitrophota bacterium]
MIKIKRNDTVKLLKGKDRGKTGKVLKVFPTEGRALIEGINFIKRHTRQTKQDQKGGIIQKEAPVRFSNLMLICKHCNKPTRVGTKIMQDGSSKARICKKCKEVIA